MPCHSIPMGVADSRREAVGIEIVHEFEREVQVHEVQRSHSSILLMLDNSSFALSFPLRAAMHRAS